MRIARDISAQPLPGITYATPTDAPPQAEISALSAVYSFILDCHAKRWDRLLDKGGPDDAKGLSKDDSSATQKYTR
jgi:hypothetical protein